MQIGRFVLLVLIAAVVGSLLWLPTPDPRPLDPEVVSPDSSAAPESEPLPSKTELADTSLRTSVDRPDVGEVDAVARSSAAPRVTSDTGIHGRVVNDIGTPVTRFELELNQQFESSNTSVHQTFDIRPRRVQRSRFESEEGSFHLNDLPHGDWSITAHGSGEIRSAAVLVTIPNDQNELVLVLPRGTLVTGTVMTPSGKRVAEAKVFVRYSATESTRFPGIAEPAPRAVSDESGGFRLEDAHPGFMQVMAAHRDYADSEWIQVAARPGETAEVIVELTTGGRIVGVIDPSRGRTANRQVDLYSFRGSMGWRRTESDSLGRFVIEHVMPQNYIIELKAPNGRESGGQGQQSIRKQIAVKEGETTDVVFGDERRFIHLVGRVTRAGAPAVGLVVSANSRGAAENRGTRCVTDVDGRFELDVDGPGQYGFHFEASRGSYFNIERTVDGDDRSVLEFEIPSGSIHGVVRGPDGRTLGNVPITVLRRDDQGTEDRASFWKRYRRARTDDHGEFEFGLLEPGIYELRAPDGFRRDSSEPGVPFGSVVIADLRVGNAPFERLDIQLQPGGRILGRVVDAAGVPVAEAAVQVFDVAGVARCAYWEITTDIAGSFFVDSMAPGIYTVGAKRNDLRATSDPVLVEAGRTTSTSLTIH